MKKKKQVRGAEELAYIHAQGPRRKLRKPLTSMFRLIIMKDRRHFLVYKFLLWIYIKT